MITDLYKNFNELKKEKKEGIDYIIKTHKNSWWIIIVAPHGGTIEPWTDEICKNIAWGDLSYYCFIATCENWEKLHITSSNFDEPQAINLIKLHKIVLTIHWCAGKDDFIFIGWKNEAIRNALSQKLRENWFFVEAFEKSKFQWLRKENICNKGNNKLWWIQIELSRGYRNKMLENKNFLSIFTKIVREVLFNHI